MNWNSINFDWNHAKAFLATAETGSLTAAAKVLNQSQPTLSRQVNALEKSLGVILFERNNKGFKVTPVGLELLNYVKNMADEANIIQLMATGQSSTLEGSICISATETMSVYILPPILKKLRKLEPSINIELIAEDAFSDLGSRESDIAIRFIRPTQDELIAKKISNIHVQLYATPEYLASIGNPDLPEKFKNAHFLNINQGDAIEMLNNKGFRLSSSTFPVNAPNMIVYWELVKQGVGVGFMSFDIGEKEPSVKRVINNLPPIEGEMWLVTHRELRFSKRIKRVYDFLAKELDAIKDRFVINS